MLIGKRILVGVTGSIAAYKSALLVRLLKKAGADVQVIMTEAAQDFITPLTLATLSQQPVLTSLIASRETGAWINHVELGLWADAFVVAPATAHTLAQCAHGLADDTLSVTYLSARCPVWWAPAMDMDMFHHATTQQNLMLLNQRGNHIIEVESGELASGLVGAGRMAEPETIVRQLERHFAAQPALQGKRVLITAGPTQEAIDPVRFISNHSTGKMGYALAEAFALAGADVHLISGPTCLSLPDAAITREVVRSADEMFAATEKQFSTADLVIFSAAVADYKPQIVAEQKIKKTENAFQLSLTKTIDIAATLGQQKKPGQYIVGFALETHDEHTNALDKLRRKNFDWIVLNSLRDAGAGFGYDTNRITIIDRNGNETGFPLKPKRDVATDILNLISSIWQPSTHV